MKSIAIAAAQNSPWVVPSKKEAPISRPEPMNADGVRRFTACCTPTSLEAKPYSRMCAARTSA